MAELPSRSNEQVTLNYGFYERSIGHVTEFATNFPSVENRLRSDLARIVLSRVLYVFVGFPPRRGLTLYENPGN
jgi:hypothetical protein